MKIPMIPNAVCEKKFFLFWPIQINIVFKGFENTVWVEQSAMRILQRRKFVIRKLGVDMLSKTRTNKQEPIIDVNFDC